MKAERFSRKIYKTGINFAVDVPHEVSKAFGMRGNIPVTGSVNGVPLKATLVPVGQGRHRLFLNGDTRKALGAGEGDTVEVSVSIDKEPRTRPVPPMFREALDKDPDAKAAWDKLPPSRKKEILAYLNNLKSPESLKRNIDKAIKNHLVFYGRKKNKGPGGDSSRSRFLEAKRYFELHCALCPYSRRVGEHDPYPGAGDGDVQRPDAALPEQVGELYLCHRHGQVLHEY
ncbi:hypothetical protein MCP_1581 [Methanocella paludicola SANAE]|uniref:DUF1905 domain-containing protein n=1 Tax=Methanocella paludicola (strain DSM 17711 / JCM 13418 / NBRC 101707 / SANAE) TaxID=304371 RepID=D1YYY1_METPS|nr:YdeI/OmpD-associated family protein [Methanocella paludicola]BAI61653.1 hypothetical protein MCP_1581 [Methanocella paludicola SANAE]